MQFWNWGPTSIGHNIECVAFFFLKITIFLVLSSGSAINWVISPGWFANESKIHKWIRGVSNFKGLEVLKDKKRGRTKVLRTKSN